MHFIIEGSLRYRSMTGFGPFKKVHIETQPFRSEIKPGQGNTKIFEDLYVEALEFPQAWLVNGELRQTACMFGEISKSNPHPVTFTMLSVANVELHATITPVVEAEVDISGKAFYVA